MPRYYSSWDSSSWKKHCTFNPHLRLTLRLLSLGRTSLYIEPSTVSTRFPLYREISVFLISGVSAWPFKSYEKVKRYIGHVKQIRRDAPKGKECCKKKDPPLPLWSENGMISSALEVEAWQELHPTDKSASNLERLC